MPVTWSAQVNPAETPEITAGVPTRTVTPAATPTGITTAIPPVTCRVKTGLDNGALHLRACGSVDCLVVGYLDERTPLTVLMQYEGWLFVQAGGNQGWVNAKYTDCQKGIEKEK